VSVCRELRLGERSDVEEFWGGGVGPYTGCLFAGGRRLGGGDEAAVGEGCEHGVDLGNCWGVSVACYAEELSSL
jgi:hypothetical protein